MALIFISQEPDDFKWFYGEGRSSRIRRIKLWWKWRYLVPVESIHSPMLTLNVFNQRQHDNLKTYNTAFATLISNVMIKKSVSMPVRRLKKKVAKETPKKEDTTKVPAKVDVTEHGKKKRKGSHIKMLARKRKRPQPDVLISQWELQGIQLSIGENDQSDFWDDQQDWEIVTWRLYEACGVYILELKDGTVIHMLVEKRYPLSKDLLQMMLDLGLEIERESTAALDLIRFIKQQIDEN
ncbi:hypothetical protein Tco_0802444 [Tanacetum coccineum]|uniref:Uncharacterized protein n=1 Tax=Tanacetum coccineum TaxID=301880 RepID=A0ABQ5A1K0_9ASTR